jgi:predicted negative regulator of RcsB-dependent stress response
MAAEKLTRKQLLRTPDKFFDKSARLLNYIIDNPKKFTRAALVAAGVVVLVLLAGQLYRTYSSSSVNRFNEVLAQAAAAESVEQRIDLLQRFLARHSGSEGASLVAAELGKALFQNGDYGSAATAYRQALEKAKAHSRFRAAVRVGLAQALEAKGDYAEGVEVLTAVQQQQEDFVGEATSLQLGRLYEALGEKEKAKAVYEQFLAKYPASASTELVRSRLRNVS